MDCLMGVSLQMADDWQPYTGAQIKPMMKAGLVVAKDLAWDSGALGSIPCSKTDFWGDQNYVT